MSLFGATEIVNDLTTTSSRASSVLSSLPPFSAVKPIYDKVWFVSILSDSFGYSALVSISLIDSDKRPLLSTLKGNDIWPSTHFLPILAIDALGPPCIYHLASISCLG